MAHQALGSTTHTPAPLLGTATTQGFAGALAIGVVSWITLLFDRNLPLPAVAAACLAAYAAVAWIHTKPAAQRTKHAVLSGLLASAASFVFTGSLVVKQPETLAALEGQQNQLTTTGILTVLIFTAAIVATGLAVAALLPKRERPAEDSRAAFAWVCAASYLPLIFVGGIVTSTESGLAVPDSVTTYGSISILFPLSLMEETRIYLEHTHRIFGTFAGVATIILVVRLLATSAPTLARAMSIALLIAVSAQGAMGAMRVSEELQWLAAFHGILAQLVFVLAVATGVVTTPRFRDLVFHVEHKKLAMGARTMLLVALIATTIQLSFGSLARHTDSAHPLISHVGFSFVVVILAVIGGAKAIRAGKEGGVAAMRRYGAAIHGIVVLQFTLGWGALAMTRTGEEGHAPIPRADELATAGEIRVAETLVTSAHHILGALLIASIGAALVWSARAARRAGAS